MCGVHPRVAQLVMSGAKSSWLATGIDEWTVGEQWIVPVARVPVVRELPKTRIDTRQVMLRALCGYQRTSGVGTDGIVSIGDQRAEAVRVRVSRDD